MGLNPIELKELHLWEFNQYVRAYQEILKEKEKNIIKSSYYTANFTRAKKVKNLKYYLDDIDNYSKVKVRNKEKLNFAKRMYEKIENSKYLHSKTQ